MRRPAPFSSISLVAALLLTGCAGSEPAAPEAGGTTPAVVGSVAADYPDLQYMLFPGDRITDSLAITLDASGPVELEVQSQAAPSWLEAELVEHGSHTFLRYGITAGAPAPAEEARLRIAARGEPEVEPAAIRFDLLVETPSDEQVTWETFCIDGPEVRDDPGAPRACVEVTLYRWWTQDGSRILVDFRNLQGSLGGPWDTASWFSFFLLLLIPPDGVPAAPSVEYARMQGKVGGRWQGMEWRPELWDTRIIELDAPFGDQVMGCGASYYAHIDRPRVSTCQPRGETGSVIVSMAAPGLTEPTEEIVLGLTTSIGYPGDASFSMGVSCLPDTPVRVCPPPRDGGAPGSGPSGAPATIRD